MGALEIVHHRGEGDVEAAVVVAAQEVADGEEGRRVDAVGPAGVLDGALTEAESYIEPANGHQQVVVVPDKLPHRVVGLVLVNSAHKKVNTLANPTDQIPACKVTSYPPPPQYPLLSIKITLSAE